MKLKRVYDVTLTLLAPLHIGSGRELLRDYDYVTQGGKTWVIDAAGMLDDFVDKDGNYDPRILGRPAAELLNPADFSPGSKRFRYVLPGEPRAKGSGAVLREMYKDAEDRPYLPGSSLKGALRTVLAWHGFREAGMKLEVDRLGDNRGWAAQSVERRILGANPNLDLLRALQVADSQPLAKGNLRIANAQVVTGSEKFGSPIEVEAVWTNNVLHTTITMDAFLHSEQAERELRYGSRWQWLETLPQIARTHNVEQLTKERDWFKARQYMKVAGLYHQMLGLVTSSKLPPNQFFLQIGWGGGWRAKTIGAPLQSDKTQWERLLTDKRRTPARFRRREGDDFPKSRRVLVVNNEPVAPFGWCLVEMKETER